MQIVITPDGVLARFGNQLAALDKKAPRALRSALAHTGDKARTQVRSALTTQTGLKRGVIVRAVKVTRPAFGDLQYIMRSSGGEISLKYFGARETRKGASAAPRGQRRVFPGAFMKGGRFPARVAARRLNGHVFKRTGAGRLPIEKQKSDVVIPDEMVTGATEAAWRGQADGLADRVGHEIGRLLP